MEAFLDTRQLRAFSVLARCGSFTEAAVDLHLTQSAVSHSIKALEDDLGARLFLRSGRKLLLTPSGHELLGHADAILRRMMTARDALSAMEKSPRGKLRIGCSTAAAQYLLLMILPKFRTAFPSYTVSVLPGETPETIQSLRYGVIDMSITLKPREVNGLTCEPIFKDRVDLLVGPEHPWKKKIPTPAQLAEETYIVTSRRSYTCELFTQHFLAKGVRVGKFIEMGSIEAMKQFVKLGLGTALAAPWAAVGDLERGELACVPMPFGRLEREWVVSCLEDRPLNQAEKEFHRLASAAGANFG